MKPVPGIPVKLLLAIGFGMFLGVLSANSIPVIIGALIVLPWMLQVKWQVHSTIAGEK